MHAFTSPILGASLVSAIALPSATSTVPASQGAVPGNLACASYVRDAASPASCITASSVPTLGALFPLGTSLFVDPEGDIGVGTTSPSADVDVHIVRGAGHALARLTEQGAFGNVAGLQLEHVPTGSGWTVGTGAIDYGGLGGLGFRTFAEDTVMVLLPSGRVGIGTTTPGRELEVAGGITANPYQVGTDFRLRENSTNWGANTAELYYAPTTGAQSRLVLFGNNSSRMDLLVSDGRVGIKTTSPSADLDVNGETATDTLRIRGGSDVAERYESSVDGLEPGTVVVLDAEHVGNVLVSSTAYDKKVIGVVSGAGGVNPGLVLGQVGALDGDVVVAKVGRVFVKCSAENGAIEVGDLLTTAALAGHAMKATDRDRAFGTVLGKAASSLADGTGLVLVVVDVQ